MAKKKIWTSQLKDPKNYFILPVDAEGEPKKGWHKLPKGYKFTNDMKVVLDDG